MRRVLPIWLALGVLFCTSCRHNERRDTLVFLIDVSPTNLDPRVGLDPQSERIDALMFDGLVVRDASYRFVPGLAERWEQPDPLTLTFHLRTNVRFHDGRLLTSRDALWTINSMRTGMITGPKAIITPKATSYASVASVEAPDAATLILHLKQPDNFLLSNLSTGAMGIVPEGSGRDFWQHPVGSGPFRFVSQEVDKEVVIERNPSSWQHDSEQGNIQHVRFAVVPDAITRALELRKGSADIASNTLLPDMLPILAAEKDLVVESNGGTQVQYLAFNTIDPILRDVRVRRAIAFAIDRDLILKTLLSGRAHPAYSLLPEQHWAYFSDGGDYPHYDLRRAQQLLKEAGYQPDEHGVRLHLTMKTSTDDFTRLLAATLQQQLAQVGIALEIRSYESATFIQDLNRGSFQMYALRWVGGNEQPDIFNTLSTARIPPKGQNRGRYSNLVLDRILDDASQTTDQKQRQTDYVKAQQILARDLPAFNLWYPDSVVVHNRRVTNIAISPSGSFDFLRSAWWGM
jgi:peptide/nickel transport system substrate-binding protein